VQGRRSFRYTRLLRTLRWAALLPAVCCLGCSGSSGLNPVKGSVLHNGQPLAGALVTFHPKGATDIATLRPVGLTGEDGTFTLTTGPDPGAPAGEYIVTFLCSEEIVPKGGKKLMSMAPPETRDRLGGAYVSPEASRFNVEIKKGDNQLPPFQLK
jgi:hypothetical protein